MYFRDLDQGDAFQWLHSDAGTFIKLNRIQGLHVSTMQIVSYDENFLLTQELVKTGRIAVNNNAVTTQF